MDRQRLISYSSEAIFLRPEGYDVLHEHVLHYFQLIEIDGHRYLVPTQGKVIRMRMGPEGEIWAYFRYHSRPTFYLVRYDGPVLPLGYMTPEDIRFRAENMAKEMKVFDRRHARIDKDFPTPGKSSDAILEIEPLLGYAKRVG